MKLLATGFDPAANERLSVLLSEAGHQVLAASGAGAARTLARAARPDALLVPGGPAGELATSWVEGLLPGVPVVVLPADADPDEALQALEALTRQGTASGQPARPRAPRPDVEAERSRGVDPSPLQSRPIEARAAESARPAVVPRAPVPEEPTAALAETAASRPAPAPAAPTPAPELASKLAQVRFGDYHAILQTTTDASPALVREQHERLRALYTPSGWTQPVHAHDIPLLDEITRGVDDAFSILGDPELRTRYERALTQAAGRHASEVDMPRLPLVLYPDVILRTKCADITDIDQELVDFGAAMAETMYVSNGIGLAAPQVARNIRLITVDVEREEGRDTLLHLVNPIIADSHGRTTYEEGCLSFPGISAEVRRKDQIHVQAYDLQGNELDFEADGLLSICIQHELDHLNGITFVDRLNPVRKKLVLKNYLQLREEEAEDEAFAAIRAVHGE